MTEEQIRERTGQILEAYQGLTGLEIVPSVAEFLQMRAAAVEELEALPTPAPARKQPRMSTCKKDETGEKPISVAAKPQRPSPVIRLAQGGSPESDVESDMGPFDEPAAGQSAFEILRRVQDPWN